MRVRNLRPLAWAVVGMIATGVLLQVASIFLVSGIIPWDGLPETWQSPALYVVIAFFGTNVVLFSWWIHAASTNLIAAGRAEGLTFTPASRIWWFFVPVANLWKPFEGMRELWNASHGTPGSQTTDPIVASWWALWLASILAGFIFRDTVSQAADFLMIAIDVASSISAILLVLEITGAQQHLTNDKLADIFG